MKTTLSLLVASALAAPLCAQDTGPGTDLIDLFEKSQREGATDEQLRQMLEDKALMDLQLPEPRKFSQDPQEQREIPEEQLRKDSERESFFRPLNGGKAADPKLELRLDRPWGAGDPELERRAWQLLGREMTLQDTLGNGTPGEAGVSDGWRIGVMTEPLEPALRAHFELPENTGLRVSSVMRGGPAAEAGLKEHDIVVSANERKIGTLDELKEVVIKAGEEKQPVQLEVIHRGERKTVTVKPRGPEPEKRQEAREGTPAKERRMMEIDPSTGAARMVEAPAMERQMAQMNRRLDQQQRQIEKLSKRLAELMEKANEE